MKLSLEKLRSNRYAKEGAPSSAEMERVHENRAAALLDEYPVE
jgi:hypothetical protein